MLQLVQVKWSLKKKSILDLVDMLLEVSVSSLEQNEDGNWLQWVDNGL